LRFVGVEPVFFVCQELRSVFGIAALKIELREELQDTLAIVESDWMEEKRNEKNSELLWKLKKDGISKRKEEILAWQKRVFDVIYSAFSALGLPFILIANIWSMNNSDLPRQVSWAYLMLGCGLVSVILFFLIYISFNRGRPELMALREEEKVLNAIRLEKFNTSAKGEDELRQQQQQLQEEQVARPDGAHTPIRRKFRFRAPKWIHLRTNARAKLEVVPLRAGSDRRDEVATDRGSENVELEHYLDGLEAGKEQEYPDDRPFEGPNYLEPEYHREFSIDIQRPMPSVASKEKNKKGLLSWLRAPHHQHHPAASQAPQRASVRDGFGELDDGGELFSARRGFSLDIPRQAVVPAQKPSLLTRLRGATTASVPSSKMTAPVVASAAPAAEPDRGHRGFSLDLERSQRGFSLDLEREITPSYGKSSTAATRFSDEEQMFPSRGFSLDIPREK
jgi:hypothetical protein